MAQEQREYTWQDLENAVGKDFSDGQVRWGWGPFERGYIRMFCEALEMDCPLHYNDEAARTWGYKGIIAPWAGVSQAYLQNGRWLPGDPSRWGDPRSEDTLSRTRDAAGAEQPLPMPKVSGNMMAEIEVEYYRPVYVGDRIGSRGQKIISVNVRRTSIGFGAFVTTQKEVVNQDGELVAHIRTTNYRYQREPRD